ncbi:hypothetical protein HDU87_000603 [Geranomyces variabilis]|uniref:SAC3/GANP/THP3 conserved domain-containing protein n=1 Tax=Geranomyces variabilis TaxID=109894 RepID=A0AAD5XIK9_9FUNG|nr:hypothetical protein HDU87_000603 [Geranomyces variabilis]
MTLDLRAGTAARGTHSTSIDTKKISPVFPSVAPGTGWSPAAPSSGVLTPQNEAVSNADRADRFASKPENNRYMELKAQRPALMAKYIAAGKMDDPDEKYRLEDARNFVGECQDMCPEYERHEREYQKGLMEFEKVPGSEAVDHARAVKRFRRSAADDEKPLPCDVRPPPVLERTLDYLVHTVLPDFGLSRTYGFLRDRMRAIRKDITLQNLRGPEAVNLFERIARYHLMCSQKLCAEIDIKQEYEQLGKTLQSLMEFYNDLRDQKVYMPNEAEFRAYYLLHHAFNSEVQSSFEHKFRRDPIISDPHIALAVRVRNHLPRLDLHSDDPDTPGLVGESVGEGAFEAYGIFFKILEDPDTPYLVACAVHPHFLIVRRHAYRHMMNALYVLDDALDTMTNVSSLVAKLGYDSEEDAKIDLDYYEIPVLTAGSGWYAQIGRVSSKGPDGKKILTPGVFNDTKQVSLQSRVAYRLIESKRQFLADSEIVDGEDGQGNEGGGMMLDATPFAPAASQPANQLSKPAYAAYTNSIVSPSPFAPQVSLSSAFPQPSPASIQTAAPSMFDPKAAATISFPLHSATSGGALGHPQQFSSLAGSTLAASPNFFTYPSAFAQAASDNTGPPPITPSFSSLATYPPSSTPSQHTTTQPDPDEQPEKSEAAARAEAAALQKQKADMAEKLRRERDEAAARVAREEEAARTAQRAEAEAARLRASQMQAAAEREAQKAERERKEALEREAAERRAQLQRELDRAAAKFADDSLEEITRQVTVEVVQQTVRSENARKKWIYFAKLLPKLHARRQAQKGAIEVLLDLAGSELASPRKASFNTSLKKPAKLHLSLGRDRDIELATACDEIAVQERKALHNIDVASVAHSVLRKRAISATSTLYFKLCVASAPCRLRSSDRKLASVTWLKAKLGGAKSPASPTYEENGTILLQKSRSRMAGADCWAVVRQLENPAAIRGPFAMSGVGALVFHFDILEPGVDIRFYFNEERDRFVNLINSLPSTAMTSKVPILFIYWMGPELSMSQVKARTKKLFELDFVLCEGPIKSIHWLEVARGNDVETLRDANEALVDQLKALAHDAPMTPEMNFIGLAGNDVIGDSLFPMHFRTHAHDLQSRFPHRMANNLDCNRYTFNVMIQLYNGAIDLLKLALTGPAARGINFPPFEFAADTDGHFDGSGGDDGANATSGVSANWNSNERLDALAQVLESAYLPYLPDDSGVERNQAAELRDRLPQHMRPLWKLYYHWITNVCAKVPGMALDEITVCYGHLFDLLERTSRVPAFASRFPFGEIADIGIQTIQQPLNDAFTERFHMAPYPKEPAVLALVEYDRIMKFVIDQWHEQHVQQWLAEEEVPEYQSDDGEEEAEVEAEGFEVGSEDGMSDADHDGRSEVSDEDLQEAPANGSARKRRRRSVTPKRTTTPRREWTHGGDEGAVTDRAYIAPPFSPWSTSQSSSRETPRAIASPRKQVAFARSYPLPGRGRSPPASPEQPPAHIGSRSVNQSLRRPPLPSVRYPESLESDDDLDMWHSDLEDPPELSAADLEELSNI